MAKPNGRPTEYNPDFINKVDEYLEKTKDEYVQFLRSNNSLNGNIGYESKLKVRLPTLEGFSLYIGYSLDAMEDWSKKYPDFGGALGKIKKEQKQRLIEMGLSGEYNPTIAKLVLSANHGMNEKTEVEVRDLTDELDEDDD